MSVIRRILARTSILSGHNAPASAWLIACYLAGLVCFGGVRLVGQLMLAQFLRTGLTPHLELVAVALLVTGMGLFLLGCRETVPSLLFLLLPYKRLILATLAAATLFLASYGLVDVAQIPTELTRGTQPQNDAVSMTDCGTQLFLKGHNPYSDFVLVDCLARYGQGGDAATPLRAGAFARAPAGTPPPAAELRRVFDQARLRHIHWPAEFEGHFSYPAGSFLLAAPAMAMGGQDLSAFNLFWLIMCYVLLAWGTPRWLRFSLGFLALANIDMWVTAVGIASDSLDTFLTLAAWVTWRRPWLSALLMGIAVSTRQNAWFGVPFYAILIGRTYGWRTVAQRLGIMAAIFTLTNGPFLLQAPVAWVDGVLGPLRDPMFPFGYGLITLAQQGWLPLWPHHVYTTLQFTATIICALIYARACRRHPGTGLVLALLPVLLAWRSSPAYFTPLAIFCLWPVLERLRQDEPLSASRWAHDRHMAARRKLVP